MWICTLTWVTLTTFSERSVEVPKGMSERQFFGPWNHCQRTTVSYLFSSQWILFSRNVSCGGARNILHPSAFETGASKGRSVRCITMLAKAGTPSVTMQGGQRPLGLKGISQAWVEGGSLVFYTTISEVDNYYYISDVFNHDSRHFLPSLFLSSRTPPSYTLWIDRETTTSPEPFFPSAVT